MARPRKRREYMLPRRSCHDCGAPTTDYRCPKCRKAHLEKWRREQDFDELDIFYDPEPYNLRLECYDKDD